ncbi:MAG: D-alanyl-D-alanine carboxypeptidase/D-alanyl-D-alanine-endopeptidase [Chlamydiia bacterium]|nr:D-alanyl-D-alanine carboxypeptidase/D-alanyl-D-alanine-endopeptidase [Chlamydiia bacterium]
MRFLIGWMCLLGIAFGGTLEERKDWIKYGVEGLIQSVDPTALVGVKVVSLDEGVTLYERNAACRFVPGSTVKLMTMAAALDQLGEEYCFKTTVRGSGAIVEGVLKGDCYLVGSGDPSLKGIDFIELVEGLGVREIRGDLVLDLSCFKDGAMGPGWMWDEEPAFWCVPMSALNVDHNFVEEAVIPHPEELAAAIFKGLLDRKGILLRGKLRVGEAPEGSVELACHMSEPLRELIKPSLQASDNLYSNCIFKAMGNSWETARQCFETFLQERVGIPPKEIRVVDGSGESRYNLISPDQMMCFLKEMRRNRVLRDALPVGKEIGTLKDRMKGFGGRVVAKTGSMTGVSSVCGYVTTETGEELAVVIFANGYVKGGREIKLKLEDEICHLLVNAPN